LPCALVLSAAALALAQTDPLPSWNDGAHKKALLDFVGRVTRIGALNLVR